MPKKVLLAGCVLALASPSTSQCLLQDLETGAGEGVQIARHGDLLGVASVQGGAFTLYRWTGTSWAQEAALPHPMSSTSGTHTDTWSIAVSENTLLVHKTHTFDSTLYFSERVGGTFQPFQQYYLSDQGWPNGSEYRSAMRFNEDGSRFVLGYGRYHYEEGVLLVWERGANGWSLVRGWHDGFGTNPDHFSLGASVAYSGGAILGGAPRTGSEGRAYLVANDVGPGSFPSRVFVPGIGPVTAYGSHVAMDGDHLAIAAATGPGLPVEIFFATPTGWTSFGALPVPASYMGGEVTGLDLEGTRLVVGVATESVAFEFELSEGIATLVGTRQTGASSLGLAVARTRYGTIADADGATLAWPEDVLIRQFCHCMVGTCGNSATIGGCTNAAGTAAVLSGCGSTSVSLDDLVMRLDGLTPNTWGTIFMGRLGAGSPLHNGQLCLGSPLYRFAPRLAAGMSMEVTGFATFSHSHHPVQAQLEAGQTWSFQSWYRDVGGPCGFTSNFTNALTVTFRP